MALCGQKKLFFSVQMIESLEVALGGRLREMGKYKKKTRVV